MEANNMNVEIEVNDGNFQEMVIEHSKKVPVVLDFWAAWCAPCLMLSPTLEKFAHEYNGKFVLAKANVDENPGTAQKYGITGIPAVKMFKDGKVVDEFVGAMAEPFVRKWLERNLG
jgi:putative thioredoxin